MFHQNVWYKQGACDIFDNVTFGRYVHNVILWKKYAEEQIQLQRSKENNKDENSMFLNIRSIWKGWITKIAHHIVLLRSSKDLSLETKKLLMSHCFVDIDVKSATPILMSLSWIFFSIFKNSIMLKNCCPSGIFPSILLVMITLTLRILGQKISDIVKGDRGDYKGVLH